ncbi:hypothetical protein DBZ36_05465 [Alginatibacterium sediminis]|uniref:Serine/threonine protein kinase n=1 Tax=Alginatibacterium sediminis TaxID=2164068 RepID=A0A420EGW0_9ALTE|nr:lipopolysaccharide kinase InaA family protein [Alginatibacterium sediminis]RKF19908.1 hypothetical protein DBZ36_05465 [Alginatibacterium sediminis]
MNQLEQVKQFLETQPANHRVVEMILDEKKVWVKRKQPLENWRDYYKVIVTPGLKREIKALQLLNRQQLPVPKLIVYCDEFFASEDSGQALPRYLDENSLDLTQRERVFYQAGYALAQMHQQGFAHGRPALRDICWDEHKITFIDFEMHSGKPCSAWDQSIDLLIFLHGLYYSLEDGAPEANAAIQGYIDNQGYTRFTKLQKKVAHFAWVLPLLDKLKGIAGRDLRQATPALKLMLKNWS